MSGDLTSSPYAFPESRIPDPARRVLSEWGIIKDNIQVRPLCRNDLNLLLERLELKSWQGVDLSGADMRGIDLRGMDLSKAILAGCKLEGAIAMPLMVSVCGKPLSIGDMAYETDLSGWHTGETPCRVKCVKHTHLDGANLNLANLSYGDFRWAKLSDAFMTRCIVHRADLSYANLSKSRLAWARLEESDLRSAILNEVSLERARIIDTDLSQASLHDADLTGAFISPLTNLNGVQWDDKYICRAEREGDYEKAEVLYRNLKEWHHRNGHYKIAGEFHYREREAARKAEWQSIKDGFARRKKDLKAAWRELWTTSDDG